jgi:hypothetical protein
MNGFLWLRALWELRCIVSHLHAQNVKKEKENKMKFQKVKTVERIISE